MSVKSAENNQNKYTKDELWVLNRIEKKEAKNAFYYGNDGLLEWVVVNNNTEIEIQRIFVKPEKRQKGIGTKLVQRLIEEAKRQKINSIFVRTGTSKKEVFGQFLLSLGFQKGNGNWHLKI
jgi:GNAT superfamily N-acetyltransferase